MGRSFMRSMSQRAGINEPIFAQTRPGAVITSSSDGRSCGSRRRFAPGHHVEPEP
jgi:hypothetical protein